MVLSSGSLWLCAEGLHAEARLVQRTDKPASVIHWVGVWFIFHGFMPHVVRANLCGKGQKGQQGARATAWMALVAILKRRGQGKKRVPGRDNTSVDCQELSGRHLTCK